MQASTFTERGDEVMAEVMTLIADESQTSHEAQLVREFYNDYVDMEAAMPSAWIPSCRCWRKYGP